MCSTQRGNRQDRQVRRPGEHYTILLGPRVSTKTAGNLRMTALQGTLASVDALLVDGNDLTLSGNGAAVA